jgi:DNA-directed RNA polymerase specialized sigma24 family protein
MYECGYNTAEIARSLSMKENTVKSKLYRTLKELREYYGEGGKHNARA